METKIQTVNIKEFSAGGFGNRKYAVENVHDFAKGYINIEVEINKEKRVFASDGSIKSSSLKKGDLVLAFYNSINQGVDIIEFLGLSDSKSETEPTFDNIKQLYQEYKVKSLSELEKIESDVVDFSMWVKDIETGDKGGWFYLYNGRWARGSGAEALSFIKIHEV